MGTLPLIDFWVMVNSKAGHPAFRTMRFGQIAFNTLSRMRPDLAGMVQNTDRDPYHVENHLHDPRFLKFCDFLIDNWER